MFQTDLLSIIRSLSTVYTAIGICHTGYAECLLAGSGWNILRKADNLTTFLCRCHEIWEP